MLKQLIRISQTTTLHKIFLANTMFDRVTILQKIKLTATFSDHRNTVFFVLRMLPEDFKLLSLVTN